ncbi:MAG: bifunctional tRNA (5-methylaminomethyl-2-thiouridine)(34)-methyltransferase MnmD/FAD-dependent 5-carboxymethylaminomethyl-2-thiouridine(34) oxidoreductase MnmC [Sulfuritalea sp.]|nr:bifunctional tRNA (5-methylaminomethyl-2-thiouridine)(34)-methyltransferase MnmD/FAD-dependent 5-carboxymethylaminomethyl-2-thiouridine(34) oxidoreductase MnmC [Sulfuritalea sp.]
MYLPLVPAEPAVAGDGTPFSTFYDDVYHAAHGAIEQARHVFLAGNNLPARWIGSDNFVVFETGFGLGLNFLATWQAWREARTGGRLHFVSAEKHPFRRDDLAKLLLPYPELTSFAEALLQKWPPLISGFHRLHFEDDRLTLTLLFGDAQALLPQLATRIDAVYLDGFTPSKNPELWSPALLTAITRLCRADATLATWSVAGELRRTLEQAGWILQRLPGFASKREMLAATRRDAVSPSPTFGPSSQINRCHAIVIGAGLAGTAISERLASRGWRIDLFERHAAPAQEASGNPAGILLPHLAKDDAFAARLSRACYLYALRQFGDLAGVRWSPCGVLQVARDSAHEALQRATVLQLKLPTDFLSFLEKDEASALVGWPVVHGGWWFPGGGWASPGSVCNALLSAGDNLIQTHFGTDVSSLRQTADGWQVFDADGNALASAPHVILANACDANRLLPMDLPLMPIRGQISCLPKDVAKNISASLRHVICRSGYLTPPRAGVVSVGASFDREDTDLRMRAIDHVGNMQRLDELLPGTALGIDPTRLGGRVGLRAAAPDRLPLIGMLPDTSASAGPAANLDNLPRLNGLHALLGLSARGLVWAPMAAELLASQLHGDPLPIERELAMAVDPARFHLRALRRGTETL